MGRETVYLYHDFSEILQSWLDRNANESRKRWDKYSLFMHRIKIKGPAIFYGRNKTFVWVDLSFFNQSYSRVITTTKSLQDIGGTTKMSATSLSCGLPWSLASTPWAMSLYIKFRAIHFWLLNEYQWWHQAKIYHIIRQLSYRFMCEIMTWSDDKTKLIHENISARLRLRALEL